MTGLFRPEALDGQRQSWLGSIQLIRPVPLVVLTALMVSAAALTVAWAFFGEYTRKAHVSGILVPDPGQIDSPGPAMAGPVSEQARLQAHLYAPASAIGFLRVHQAVLLRYQAFPYQKFGHYPGRVLQVSRTPLQASEFAGLSLSTASAGAFSGGPNAGEPLYRITVALDRQAVSAYGQALPLAAGMQIEADVSLDRRRLIEWLFEPVPGLAGRV